MILWRQYRTLQYAAEESHYKTFQEIAHTASLQNGVSLHNESQEMAHTNTLCQEFTVSRKVYRGKIDMGHTNQFVVGEFFAVRFHCIH